MAFAGALDCSPHGAGAEIRRRFFGPEGGAVRDKEPVGTSLVLDRGSRVEISTQICLLGKGATKEPRPVAGAQFHCSIKGG